MFKFICIKNINEHKAAACCRQAASVALMSSKDSRLGLMGEILHHMGVVKALGWESVLAAKVSNSQGWHVQQGLLWMDCDSRRVLGWILHHDNREVEEPNHPEHLPTILVGAKEHVVCCNEADGSVLVQLV